MKGSEAKAPRFDLQTARIRTCPDYVVGVDPGPVESAYLVLERGSRCLLHGIEPNDRVLELLSEYPLKNESHLSLEMISSYGMPVGWETYETVYWIGRFAQAWGNDSTMARIYRVQARSHLCGSGKAGDPEVWRAILDRFGPSKALAVGTKKAPGPLYGVTSHKRSALAVALVYWDLVRGVEGPTPPHQCTQTVSY